MKRAIDIAFSIIGLVLLAPFLVVTGVLVALFIGRPILFRQSRPGLHGKPFSLVKFRTMRDDRDENGVLLPDVDRLTKFGAFLRETSIDELPELWNVLRGDMSLVGPRPLLMQYLPLYTPEQARRHEMRPGLTGWAQINGRNSLSWDEKFSLDTWYVEHANIGLDLKIIFLTVRQVMRRHGINASNMVGQEMFRGRED